MRRILAVALVVVGCGGHSGDTKAPDMAFAPAFAAHANVDILFVLADFTILPKRQELVNRFPQLVKALDAAAPASYHIGIITTDLGAGPFTLNQGQCHPDGDGAKLQITPVPTELGPPACSGFSLSGRALHRLRPHRRHQQPRRRGRHSDRVRVHGERQ